MTRKLFFFVLAAATLFSCGGGDKGTAEGTADADTTVVDDTIILTDSMAQELRMAHDRSMELFTSEQFYKYVEYLYPGYFKYMQRQKPRLHVQDIKDQYVEMLAQQSDKYWESQVSHLAPQAEDYIYEFKDVKRTAATDGNLLVTYSRQAVYHTPDGDVTNPDREEGLAIYLDSAAMWYLLDPSTPDIRQILALDFDSAAISRALDGK